MPECSAGGAGCRTLGTPHILFSMGFCLPWPWKIRTLSLRCIYLIFMNNKSNTSLFRSSGKTEGWNRWYLKISHVTKTDACVAIHITQITLVEITHKIDLVNPQDGDGARRYRELVHGGNVLVIIFFLCKLKTKRNVGRAQFLQLNTFKIANALFLQATRLHSTCSLPLKQWSNFWGTDVNSCLKRIILLHFSNILATFEDKVLSCWL